MLRDPKYHSGIKWQLKPYQFCPIKLLLKRGCALSIQVNKQVIRFNLKINQVRELNCKWIDPALLENFSLAKGSTQDGVRKDMLILTKGKRALKGYLYKFCVVWETYYRLRNFWKNHGRFAHTTYVLTNKTKQNKNWRLYATHGNWRRWMSKWTFNHHIRGPLMLDC